MAAYLVVMERIKSPLTHSLGSAGTKNLIQRIHDASSLAKVSSGRTRKRLYRIKRDGVLHFAYLFPEQIYLTHLDRLESGEGLFGLSAFRLGRLHLLVSDPFEIMRAISPAPGLRASMERKCAS